MPRPRVIFSGRGWVGMRWATDVRNVPQDHVWYALNMVPHNGVYWRRPSFINSALITSDTSNATASGFFSMMATAPGNGEVTFAVLGGEIYGTAPGGTSWSKLVSAANFASASITRTTSGAWYGCQFGNVFVLNDGTNAPFTWDGTSGAGGLVKLTNAPSKCYGRPTVYYGKLFFIKDVASNAADRSTIVWSEENAANTGYEATIGGTTYNNAWTLSQMGQGGLYAILGLNDGLYYWRSSSIGVIRGTVTTDFAASGVHDNVALGHGTVYPKSPCYYNGWLWFLDQNARPLRIALGTFQVQELWRGLEAAFGDQGEFAPLTTTGAFVPTPFTVPVASIGAIWMGGAGKLHGSLFDAATGECLTQLLVPCNTQTVTSLNFFDDAAPQLTGKGIGTLVRTTVGTPTGWSHLVWPAATVATQYSVAWPETATSALITLGAQGDIGAMIRYAFSECRVQFVVSGVASGTKTQTVLLSVNTGAFATDPLNTLLGNMGNQTISNAAVQRQDERVTKAWGLARELPYLTPQIWNTAAPVEMGWGIVGVDTLAYQLNAGPDWSIT